MPKCIILVGAPTSGKSTFANKTNMYIVSRDKTRLKMYGQIVNYKVMDERKVTIEFNRELEMATQVDVDIIVDNTHLRAKYVHDVMRRIPLHYDVELKFFRISLLKAMYRNIIRWCFTRRWIPIDYLRQCIENFEIIKNNEEHLFHFRHSLSPQEHLSGDKYMGLRSSESGGGSTTNEGLQDTGGNG